MKIRILHLIKSLGRGGAETLIPQLMHLHDKNRFEFHCIFFLPWKDQMVNEIKQNDGKVKCLPSNNNVSLFLKFNLVAKYVKNNKIDLVHCHLPWAGFVGRILYLFYGIKVIYTEHNKQERYHIITRIVNRVTFNWQNLAIAVSKDVRESINKNISPKIPVEVVLNGVNTSIFTKQKGLTGPLEIEMGIPQNSIVVGTVAVFRLQKRLKEWLDIFAEASKKESKLVGIIVGDGPLRQEIIDHRDRLGLTDKIIMPGLKTDVKPFLSLFDIYMITSIFEGLPIALLEAMSTECAILTTNAGGIKEVIHNERDGIMLDVKELHKMPGLLLDFCEDEKRIKRFGQEARNTVLRSFSLERMTRELEGHYSAILN